MINAFVKNLLKYDNKESINGTVIAKKKPSKNWTTNEFSTSIDFAGGTVIKLNYFVLRIIGLHSPISIQFD